MPFFSILISSSISWIKRSLDLMTSSINLNDSRELLEFLSISMGILSLKLYIILEALSISIISSSSRSDGFNFSAAGDLRFL